MNSDQPIAVFGGGQGCQIPVDTLSENSMAQQMIPTDRWASEYFTVPFATRACGDVIRVIASRNGTNLSLNGTTYGTLNPYWQCWDYVLWDNLTTKNDVRDGLNSTLAFNPPFRMDLIPARHVVIDGDWLGTIILDTEMRYAVGSGTIRPMSVSQVYYMDSQIAQRLVDRVIKPITCRVAVILVLLAGCNNIDDQHPKRRVWAQLEASDIACIELKLTPLALRPDGKYGPTTFRGFCPSTFRLSEPSAIGECAARMKKLAASGALDALRNPPGPLDTLTFHSKENAKQPGVIMRLDVPAAEYKLGPEFSSVMQSKNLKLPSR